MERPEITATTAPGAAAGRAIAAQPRDSRARLALRDVPRALGLEQVLRLTGCAAVVGAGRLLDLVSSPETRTRRRRRAVARIVATLGELKGPFAKAGQFAAIRHDLLPGEVTDELGRLRDRVPPLPFGRIRETVERELGAPLASVFESFDPEPLGAASVAQVHRARLLSGEEVAVKVQYPWLEASLRADLRVSRWCLALVTRGRDVDRDRLFGEFAAGLAEELDFEREADVAQEIAGNLAHDPRVVVPRPLPRHSSRRVLTMSYHPAIPIDDRERLDALGVDRRDVLSTLARAYAKQVFVDGLFHADPHPGNLFVVDEPGAATAPRLLFVDFGLSRRLDPVLRREMRTAVYALLKRDVEGFLDGMDRLGMIAPGARDGVRNACAAMFERFGSAGGLAVGGSQVLGLKDEAKSLLQDTPGLQLPNDLLLYAKTMTYVFGLGAQIAPEVDLMQLSLPYLVQFLAEKNEQTAS